MTTNISSTATEAADTIIRNIEAAIDHARSEAMHASAPPDHRCSDCTIDNEPCVTCYTAWWKKRHPHHREIVLSGDAYRDAKRALCFKALDCLYIAVEERIAQDVDRHVRSYISAMEEALRHEHD